MFGRKSKNTPKTYIKAFVVGSSYFVVLTPLVYLGVSHFLNPTNALTYEFVPIELPILFGLINVLYIHFKDKLPGKNLNTRYLVIGAIYGAGLSSYSNLVPDLPTHLFLLPYPVKFVTIPVAMVIYALVWRFIMKNLNHLFELE